METKSLQDLLAAGRKAEWYDDAINVVDSFFEHIENNIDKKEFGLAYC